MNRHRIRNRPKQLLIIAWTGLLLIITAVTTTAHYDESVPEDAVRIEDRVYISEIRVQKDWDDGLINADAELCAWAIFQHKDHNLDSFTIPFSVNISGFPISSNQQVEFYFLWPKCKDVNMEESESFYDPQQNAYPWVIIGDNGAWANIAPEHPMKHHRECSPKANWDVTIAMQEVGDDATDIIEDLNEAIGPAVNVLTSESYEWGRLAIAAVNLLKLMIDTQDDDLGTVTILNIDGQDGAEYPGQNAQFSAKVKTDLITHDTICAPSAAVMTTEPLGMHGEGPNHIFGRNALYAWRSWKLLLETASPIQRMGTSTSEINAEVAFRQKRTAIEVVTSFARLAAEAELAEAQEKPEAVAEVTMETATLLLEKGDHYRERAIQKADAVVMKTAIGYYMQLFDLLVPKLHPEFNAEA